MSSAMTFKGSYRYPSEDAMQEALDAAEELLEGEDEDFPDPFEDWIKRKGADVQINIDTSCPSDWFFTFESIIEELAIRAVSGSVESTLEGTDESVTYPAGGA